MEEKKQVVDGLEKISISRLVIPTDELKEFYVREATIATPSLCLSNNTEHELLCILQGQLQKQVSLISNINNNHWEKLMITAQTLFNNYLLQDDIDKEKRVKMGEDIIEIMQLFTLLAANRTTISKIQSFLSNHNENVKKLLRHCAEDEKIH